MTTNRRMSRSPTMGPSPWDGWPIALLRTFAAGAFNQDALGARTAPLTAFPSSRLPEKALERFSVSWFSDPASIVVGGRDAGSGRARRRSARGTVRAGGEACLGETRRDQASREPAAAGRRPPASGPRLAAQRRPKYPCGLRRMHTTNLPYRRRGAGPRGLRPDAFDILRFRDAYRLRRRGGRERRTRDRGEGAGRQGGSMSGEAAVAGVERRLEVHQAFSLPPIMVRGCPE